MQGTSKDSSGEGLSVQEEEDRSGVKPQEQASSDLGTLSSPRYEIQGTGLPILWPDHDPFEEYRKGLDFSTEES